MSANCRMLVDQLTQEKRSLQSRCVQAQTALQQMLNERQQLNENMISTHRYASSTSMIRHGLTERFLRRFVKTLNDSLTESPVRKPPEIVPNILELSRTNLRLSESLKHKLLGSTPVFAGVLDVGIQNGMSPAEKLAYQVRCNISSYYIPSQHIFITFNVLQTILSDLNTPRNFVGHSHKDSFSRFHPQVRFEGFVIPCCCRCKGELHVV